MSELRTLSLLGEEASFPYVERMSSLVENILFGLGIRIKKGVPLKGLHRGVSVNRNRLELELFGVVPKEHHSKKLAEIQLWSAVSQSHTGLRLIIDLEAT